MAASSSKMTIRETAHRRFGEPHPVVAVRCGVEALPCAGDFILQKFPHVPAPTDVCAAQPGVGEEPVVFPVGQLEVPPVAILEVPVNRVAFFLGESRTLPGPRVVRESVAEVVIAPQMNPVRVVRLRLNQRAVAAASRGQSPQRSKYKWQLPRLRP